MKYQVNMFYSLQVEAENEEQAEEKAGEYIASEEGQGVRLSDMSIEVEPAGVPCKICGGPRDVEALICSKCKPEDGQAGKPLDYVPEHCEECDCEGSAEGRHEPECR